MAKINLEKKDIKHSKLCTVSLVISAVITVLFIIFSVAPLLSEALGICIYIMVGIGAVILTVCSFGMVWIDRGFRNEWNRAFDFANKLMHDGSIIAKSIGFNVIWISIIVFIVCSFGFIVNLINYKKYKNNKARLIVSIVFISIATICLTASNIVYLTYTVNP